ncbi:MAG: polymerase, sigma-24 subunit, subfamily [Chthoniobacteraceae bacterium]|nr:polymerase, sigma-24 subunit, subfamily [Chthoniobacteraceae bacterium]
MPSDASFDVFACLDGVRRHDAESARALVEHLFPLVIKIVRSYRSRRLAEEDLAQEIFLKMFTRLDQYHGHNGVPFEHWLSRIAVTTCLDGLRAEKRRPEYRWADLSDGEREWMEFWAAKESASLPTDAIGAREAVEKLLALLSPEDRLVITLLDLEERTLAEIGTLTGWGISRIKVRAFRARQKLRKHALKMQKESKL